MVVALLDVSSQILAALERARHTVVACNLEQTIEQQAGRLPEPLDVLVVGWSVSDPVQWATRAYRLDPELSVVILGADLEQCQRIRSVLRFAPLIGRDVVCSDAQEAETVTAIQDAASRTRARRTHQHRMRALNAQLAPRPSQPLALRERYAAQLVELAPTGIVVTDQQRRVVSLNAEAARILRTSERELIGAVFTGASHGIDTAALTGLFASATAEPQPPLTLERKTSTGRLHLEARVVCIREDSGTGYLLLLQDITQRVALEQQKDDALARAEAASRLKDEFLATISHELRTPLNAVLGWARLLRTPLAPEKRERALEIIERNALLQSQLIEDLLDVTRITTGKLRLEVESAELAPIIEAAIDTVRPSAEAKAIVLTQVLDSAAGVVRGDPQRLQQVVWNLLSNAVKFTPKGGHVAISLERVDSQIVLTVSDDGQGIAPELLRAIFEPFRQADGSATRRHGGLGLGLAITKHLVELHGGTIEARSEGVGKGALFKVNLPLASVRWQRQVTHATTTTFELGAELMRPPELIELRVLVVDDEEDARELVADVLATCGANVRSASSVLQALQAVDDFSPDVILSDIGMPGEDGYALIRKLRARPRQHGGATPVAALTAYARAEDRRRALDAGFQMHVAKPVEPSELLEVVASLARMAKLVQ